MVTKNPEHHYPILQKDGITIQCPCGWTADVTKPKYAVAIIDRHLKNTKES